MKRNKLIISSAALLLSVALLGACGNGSTKETKPKSGDTAQSSTEKKEKVDINKLELPQLNKEVAENEALVEMVTSEGNIKIKLFPEQAPKAVENFMTHAKDGYYNGVKFHRIMDEFMIQSGDPKGDGTGGESIWKEEFAPEISNQLYHLDGALAMARTNAPVTEKTQGSQFYIVHNTEDKSDGLLSEDYPDKIIEAYKKGGTPMLDFNYSVFGQVIEGMDTVDKIAKTEVKAGPSGEASTPTKDVKIEKINILKEAKK
ncbi:peptidylprolyl isomerase [Vagococcus hydrophili]|uniref:Peptidyl-prolyl cis-trans isomerase n=1 Tax=Vagococcus hydrophili TaxID=2714947 RepID=A0A6G8AV61_9ENTE|nr:peptidylprolyl isomerase [Vagococcus hydrophili]QIL48877.1 peptidylprolyl isomerase [Vagococcus hydrophili]